MVMAFGTFAVAICLLGFGITGFIELADAGGASLLVFQFNPVELSRSRSLSFAPENTTVAAPVTTESTKKMFLSGSP